MRILQICNKPPFPPIDGGAIAMNNITQGLINQGHTVKVLSICTPKHPTRKEDLPNDYIEKTDFECVYIDTSIKVKDAFLNLFSNKSYNIERFISPNFSSKIKDILKKDEYDIVVVESLFVTPYVSLIKKHSKAKVILRAHNVEHKIWERISENTKNPIKRKYIDLLAKRLKSYEVDTFQELDAICAMTKLDKNTFENLGYKKSIATVPTGYILNGHHKNGIKMDKNSIFHIASMNWMPNLEGVEWFLENVWNAVKTKSPNANLFLAGRDMPEEMLNMNKKDVKVIGEVKSAKEFYLSKKIMIVPLLSGSGMRIKIIEGMALGKVIVSTSIGAEGINYTDNKNILIANTPEEFATKINKCLNDEDFYNYVSNNARELIKQEYNNDTIVGKMTNFFETIE